RPSMWRSRVRPTGARRRVASDAPEHAGPEMLVELKLDADGQGIVEHPTGEIAAGQGVVNRREQHGHLPCQLALAHDASGPLVVRAAGDHELELVAFAQPIEVLPEIALALAASRALHVDDALDAERHGVDRKTAAGLEQHFVSTFEKGAHQVDR